MQSPTLPKAGFNIHPLGFDSWLGHLVSGSSFFHVGIGAKPLSAWPEKGLAKVSKPDFCTFVGRCPVLGLAQGYTLVNGQMQGIMSLNEDNPTGFDDNGKPFSCMVGYTALRGR